MRFFNDPTGFTHKGSIEGIPCYLKDPYSEGPMAMGTNVITDWLLLHVTGPISGLRTFCWGMLGVETEPAWLIRIQGKL